MNICVTLMFKKLVLVTVETIYPYHIIVTIQKIRSKKFQWSAD